LLASRAPGSVIRRAARTASAARSDLIACLVVVALCAAVGVPTIRPDNYFLGDDFGLVHHLHDLPLVRFVSYFYSDWTEGIYGAPLDELRPFLAFTYWLDSHLFGAVNVRGYHATNVVLHAVNGLLVWAIVRSVAARHKARALLAASLFALTPSHAEPIAWISGRVDSLAALFYLGAFLCFVRFRLDGGASSAKASPLEAEGAARRRGAWLVAALLIFICGLFAKQTLVTFPLLVLAYDVVCGPSPRRWTRRELLSRYAPHLLFALLVVAYLAFRHALFGNAVREELITPRAFKEFGFRQYFYLASLAPLAGTASSSATVRKTVLLIALGACGLGLVLRAVQERATIRNVIFFGPAWYVLTIAPMLVSYTSARHLYVTAAGLSIALASLILPERSAEWRLTWAARVGLGVALVWLNGAALARNIVPWIENGLESQRFVATLPSLLQHVPRGSVAIVSVPATLRQRWFWSWSLPFALEPPFQREDLYGQYRIVERPDVYCCPVDRWKVAKRTALMSLWTNPTSREIAAIRPTRQGSLWLTIDHVDSEAFREQIERALRKPIESLGSPITEDEAQELALMVLEGS
jgi:hypothetical protein